VVGEFDLIIASPPYAEIRQDGGKGTEIGADTGLTQGKRYFDEYGETPGQLGRMKEGGIDLIVGSPPFAETNHPTGWSEEYQKKFIENINRKYPKRIGKGNVFSKEGYFEMPDTEGQLGAMKEGEVAVTEGDIEMSVDQWDDCYEKGWQGKIVKGAFAHPAKFSRGLILRIYEHAKDKGWLKKGDLVFDPFAGVALGAFYSGKFGFRWVGVELEEKFFKLGQENIVLWGAERRAIIIQGDSRKLKFHIARLIGTPDLLVASPPYMDRVQAKTEWEPTGEIAIKRGGQSAGRSAHEIAKYDTPGNLGNMKEGDVDVVVSSPPYSETNLKSGGWKGKSHDPRFEPYGETEGQLGEMKEGDVDLLVASPPFTDRLHQTEGGMLAPHQRADHGRDESKASVQARSYGHTSGNLGNMKEGDVDVVVSSPPFHSTEPQEDKEWVDNKDGTVRKNPRHSGEKLYFTKYDKQSSEGNLANMEDGDIDLVVSSPPFTDVVQAQDPKYQSAGEGHGPRHSEYGETEGNLGNMKEGNVDLVMTSPPYEEGIGHGGTPTEIDKKKALHEMERYGKNKDNLGHQVGDTFWGASKEIVQQCYDLLKPGGYAIWVTKDYIKNKQRVPFSDRWEKLCESVGFKTVCRHHAMVVKKYKGIIMETKKERKSFFRKLAEKRGSPPIDWEDVICQVKPE
jgi:DNA modification methylase